MKKECLDEKIGIYLHAYEISALDDVKRDLFENHLLKCDACFNQVKEFENESILLKQDIIIKECIQTPQGTINFYKEQFSATALMLAAIVVLMIYPSYLGLTSEEASSIKTVDSIMLVPVRSAGNSYSLNEQNDIVLSFHYPDVDSQRKYNIELYLEKELLFSIDSFNDFDQYKTGRVLIPKEVIVSGNYRCILKNNSNSRKILQEYCFRVI